MTAHGLDTSCAPAAAHGQLGNNPCADGGVGYKQLVAGFIRRAQAILRARGRTPSHWQEVFDHYGGNDSATPTPPIDGLDPSAVIYDWLAPGWGWANPGNITRAGWRVVSTIGMYLSSNADATDWPAYYNLHPLYLEKNGTGAYNVSDPAEVAPCSAARGACGARRRTATTSTSGSGRTRPRSPSPCGAAKAGTRPRRCRASCAIAAG